MIYLRSLGVAEFAAGENEAADRDLERAGRRLEEIGFREPAVWRVEADRIEAAVEVGDTARAERLTTRLERQAERSQIPWSLAAAARSRGILAAASSDTEGATAALTRALVAHERCPVPFERARTLLVLGRVHRRAKRKRLASEALTAALGIFEDVRSELWAERTRSELQRVRDATSAGRLDSNRAADCATGSRGPDEQRHRRHDVRQHEDGRGQPQPCLPQARHLGARAVRPCAHGRRAPRS